jgi:N-acetyl-beta-hexosaminidase
MDRWKIRAAQLDLARQKENLEFITAFIDFIARYNYNTLLLYLEGKVRTKTFPYPSPEWSYTPEEMKEVVAYAKKKKIDIIPAVSNLGHTEHFLKHPQLKHLAELREGRQGRFGGSSLSAVCPSLDETYGFFESYFADMAEIFPSQYFHVGCDESWDMGICSLCRARAKKDGEHSLFTGHLLRTHKVVTGKLKKRMLMWDDLFEAYPESLKAVPRDIIMCSWFYDPVFDVPRSHFYNRKAEDVFRTYDKMGISYLIAREK